MRVQVISNASEAHQGKFIGKTAIVIDVFRSSSSIVSALASGATCVIPVETVMDAKQIYKEHDILGGERFCKRISGFHYGNSPLEYRSSQLIDRRVILTTTNGTRAIHRSKRASNIYIASLNNAKACANAALNSNNDLVILCAGSHDQFTIEDGLCAGYILAHLVEHSKNTDYILQIDDFGKAMLALYEHNKSDIAEVISRGLSGNRLQELDMTSDIEDCARLDVYDIVPVYLNGVVVVKSSNETYN
ncbi:2-phosphosulfolactate phosphatase [Paenibacillus endoradicis]|uniref:2-phosphosulfolactate phosphatase n=1 Tax=Paenibacillus endoradicis TaxID=2972487 RepID=UPI0021593CA5|nr:2-phosphosulfolactate phosphatase [Paenibacillus endoradicis]MCR8659278.1 2-phosphosulfolactate phosphatase [Paenibacillus endoradicis]